MSRCRHLSFILSLFIMMPTISLAQSSFTELTDVPFMEGMVEGADDWVQFDTPEGHILQTRAQISGKTVKDIRRFYQDTLPEVGWVYDREGDFFSRDGDVLTLNFVSEKDNISVLFEIKTK